MQLQTEIALLEAILFLETDPIHLDNLVKIMKLSSDQIKALFLQLEDLYKEENRGIELIRLGNSYQLLPKQKFWAQLKDRYGKKNVQRLSKAAMETLSIIAYSQPITRSEVEGIRGISSDSMIRLLMNRELIQDVGRKDAVGKPLQYGTTLHFLKLFHLSSIADLPKLDEVEQSRFELKKGN